ncbi:MAG: N-acetylmuramoyl-L-alanine amidase, partial [Bacteroidetes bacterium]|nr:N-acetylmuramoyl-L-alanine amidase [Bacteroidota bacterium]
TIIIFLKLGILICLFSCGEIASDTQTTNSTQSTSRSESRDSIDYLAAFYDSLKIITRESWGATPPISEMKTHELKRITIHHSAVKHRLDYDPAEKIKGLQRFSQSESQLASGKMKEAWADIPYHFIIYANGEIVEGRSLEYVGDTNTEYDPSGHLLINLDGNFEEQVPTEPQIKSLINLCFYFSQKYKIDIALTEGHKDFAQTLCPGKNLYEQIPSIKDAILTMNIKSD